MTDGMPGQIGKAIQIRGELRGREDLIIEGRVEGAISFPNNHLTIEKSATIQADVEVQNITVKGEVNGNTNANNRVEIMANAKVAGDIKSPRLVMEDGAKFRGSVDMAVKLPPGLLD